jgi:hypothetical protein
MTSSYSGVNFLALFFQLSLKIKFIQMKKVLFLLLVCFCTVGFAQNEKPVEVPQILVRIPLGETAQLGDVSVKFNEVLEDSRCPKDVTCIWAGRARVQLEVTMKDKAMMQKEVIIGQTKPGESANPVLYNSDGIYLKVSAVTPHPTSEDNGVREYAVLISDKK